MRLERLAADDVNISKEKHSPVITAIVIATCNYKIVKGKGLSIKREVPVLD